MERVKSESALPSFSRFVAQPEPKPSRPRGYPPAAQHKSRGHDGEGDAEADAVVKRSHAEGEASYALTLGRSIFSITGSIAVGSMASSGRPGSSGDVTVSCSISSI